MPCPHDSFSSLADFITTSRRLVILTGAGCSTASGIPDYRGPNGTWTRRRPIMIGDFVRSEERRRNFWARNFRGWPRFAGTLPNAAHHAIAELERRERLELLITQNVDDLHQRAGNRRLVALHGTNDSVICLQCSEVTSRARMQERLAAANPGWSAAPVESLPDGDAELDAESTRSFVVPPCENCDGVLKPHLVFFGESVPRERVERCMEAVAASDGVLVVGSSLTVWSGYRFALAASERGLPLAIVNRGPTRADALAQVRVDDDCGEALSVVGRVSTR